MSRISTRSLHAAAFAATLLSVAACGDTAPTTAPDGAPRTAVTPAPLLRDRLATIEYAGRFPALFLQDMDGKGRMQVHFTNVSDHVEGNYSRRELPVTDETIMALGPARWSPDGRQLAVVVTVGMDQSQIVVMDAEGHAMRTVSPNSQVILGDIEWSAASRAIAYTLSTDCFGRRADLFVTDLGRDLVTRLTTTGSFSVFDEYRFDASGTHVWYTQFDGRTADDLNRVSRLERVDRAGNVERTGRQLIGNPQGLARDGSWAVALRRSRDDATWEFVRSSTEGGADQLHATGTGLLYAELLSDERNAVLVSDDPATYGRRYELRAADSGADRGRLPVDPFASSMAVVLAPR